MLIVEDEFIVALDMCMALQDAGYTTLGPVASVEGALSLINTETPDVALLDENLMSASVAPVAAELKRRGVPYGIVSAYREPLTDDDALRGVPRLSKPTLPSAILDMVARLQNGHRPKACGPNGKGVRRLHC